MILFKQASRLSQYLYNCKKNGKKIGFVPTMGALHKGHLSLLQKAKAETDLAVCSIFINPTQFTNPDDFNRYPVTLEKDIDLLTGMGCHVLFLPPVNEIYPAAYHAVNYELGILETILEGHFRPGHFQGVCQVVDRLLDIVQPNTLYLGQKDYQQCQVIRRLLELTDRNQVRLVTGSTIREENGLAMSSRNLRLSPEQRSKAAGIYKALCKAKSDWGKVPPTQINDAGKEALTSLGLRVDYFEVVDATTLLPVTEKTVSAIAVVAAYLDNVRLIDNLAL